MTRLRELLLNTMFPVACLSCGAWHQWMCPAHLDQAIPASVVIEGFDGVLSTGSYADPDLQHLVTQLKFSGYRECARLLGIRMATQLRHQLRLYDLQHTILVPLPLSRWRLNQRGFNQSALLAHTIGQELGLQVEEHALTRSHRRAQSNLAHRYRAQNSQNVFSLRSSGGFASKTLILVDDVVTTGSTLRSCAEAIRASVKPARLFAVVAAHG